MKKVLIINHTGYLGGGGVSLMHIIRALQSMPNKYSVEVYCPENPPDMCDWIESNNIPVIRGDSSPVILNHYSGNDKFILSRLSLTNIKNIIMKKGLKDIKKAIQRSNPDIVALNSMTMCWMGVHIKSMGFKVVCFHRETYAKGLFGLRTKYIKHCLKKHFNGVAFISKNDFDETGVISGYPQVITDKVDLNAYNLSIPKYPYKDIDNNQLDELKVIYLGGMTKLKGAHIIIKSLNALKNKNIRLIFLKFDFEKRKKRLSDYQTMKHKLKYILKMDYEARVLKLIDNYGLWNKIDFIPTVKKPEKYILNSDIIVFPSTSAHQARPIYEAGAAGKPIIITDFQQTSEFAKKEYNCLVFTNGDYMGLSEEIYKLSKNKELYNYLSENNYKQTIENHNLSKLPAELDKFFSNIK